MRWHASLFLKSDTDMKCLIRVDKFHASVGVQQMPDTNMPITLKCPCYIACDALVLPKNLSTGVQHVSDTGTTPTPCRVRHPMSDPLKTYFGLK